MQPGGAELRRLLPAAEAALIGVSLMAVSPSGGCSSPGRSSGRCCSRWLAAHATMIVTRRLGWELWAVALVSWSGPCSP